MLLYLALFFLAAVSADSRPDGTVACDPALRPVIVTQEFTAISSPDDPGNPGNYANNQLCEYLIEAPENFDILLIFSAVFAIEDCTDCQCDSIEIWEGTDDTGNKIFSSCGTVHDSFELVAMGRNAFVRFVSDDSVAFEGFSAQVNFVDAACELPQGAILSNPGSIASPNFPGSYPNDETCRWVIQPPAGQNVQFDFTSFDLEQGCDFLGAIYDYVQFSEADGTVLGRYYGPDFVPGFTYESYGGGGAEIQFISDFTVGAGGFNLTYRFV